MYQESCGERQATQRHVRKEAGEGIHLATRTTLVPIKIFTLKQTGETSPCLMHRRSSLKGGRSKQTLIEKERSRKLDRRVNEGMRQISHSRKFAGPGSGREKEEEKDAQKNANGARPQRRKCDTEAGGSWV